MYQSNQRQSNAHTKMRGEVRGGGKKPWRQKGTGRARHGSIRSPIWTGGGVTFGPRNERNFKKKMPKRMRQKAMISALSYKANEGDLSVVEELKVKKTQELDKLISKFDKSGKVTILVDKNESLLRSAKNLPNVSIKTVNDISAYDIVDSGYLVIEEPAVEKIYNKWKSK